MMIKSYYINTEGGTILNHNVSYAKSILMSLIEHKRSKEHNYIQITCPSLMHKNTLTTSGHLENFQQNMFLFEDYGLKPMNCPNHAIFVKNIPKDSHLYNISVLNIFETSNLFRYEPSGDLTPLLRCNSFSQDDTHTFIKNKNDIAPNIIRFLNEWHELYANILNLEYRIVLGTQPNNTQSNTNFSESEMFLKSIIDEYISHNISEKKEGNIHNKIYTYIIEEENGAFYGPKLDLQIFLNDKWIQLATIQLDYDLCKKFRIKEYQYVIHSALFGSFERFLYILLNLNNNNFPFWCDRKPFALISLFKNVTEDEQDYYSQVFSILSSMGNVEKYDNVDLQHTLSHNLSTHLYLIGSKEYKNKTLSTNKNTIISIDELYNMYNIFRKIKKFFNISMNIYDFHHLMI